jgi:hypothetical protein
MHDFHPFFRSEAPLFLITALIARMLLCFAKSIHLFGQSFAHGPATPFHQKLFQKGIRFLARFYVCVFILLLPAIAIVMPLTGRSKSTVLNDLQLTSGFLIKVPAFAKTNMRKNEKKRYPGDNPWDK